MLRKLSSIPSPLILLLCSGIILAVGMGMRNTFGLFLAPMSLDLELPRETFALSIAIQMLVWGASQPIFGALSDRYGAGKVVALGGIFYVLGLALMSQATTPWGLHGSLGLLVGLGISAAGFAVILGPVGRAFPPKKRSMALGLASAGGSAGQLIMAPVGGTLINSMGWSASLIILAIIAGIIIPLAIGIKGENGRIPDQPEQSLGEALKEASKYPSYWLLCGGFFVCGFHVSFIATHLPPFLADNNMAPMLAAAAIGIIGFFNILGTLSSGWLGGIYSQKYVLSYYYLARSIVLCGFLVIPVSQISVLIFSALIGFLWLGTVPLTSGLVARIFGPRYLGALFGVVFFSHQLGGFLGAWVGGVIFDLRGNYDLVWLIAVVLGLVAAILHWFITDRPITRETLNKHAIKA